MVCLISFYAIKQKMSYCNRTINDTIIFKDNKVDLKNKIGCKPYGIWQLKTILISFQL